MLSWPRTRLLTSKTERSIVDGLSEVFPTLSDVGVSWGWQNLSQTRNKLLRVRFHGVGYFSIVDRLSEVFLTLSDVGVSWGWQKLSQTRNKLLRARFPGVGYFLLLMRSLPSFLKWCSRLSLE